MAFVKRGKRIGLRHSRMLNQFTERNAVIRNLVHSLAMMVHKCTKDNMQSHTQITALAALSFSLPEYSDERATTAPSRAGSRSTMRLTAEATQAEQSTDGV